MKCRDLYTQLPVIEKMAAREGIPRATAVKIGLALVPMRNAWNVIEEERSQLLVQYSEDGKITDAEGLNEAWSAVLDVAADYTVKPLGSDLDALFAKSDITAVEFAAMYTLGLLVEAEEG